MKEVMSIEYYMFFNHECNFDVLTDISYSYYNKSQ